MIGLFEVYRNRTTGPLLGKVIMDPDHPPFEELCWIFLIGIELLFKLDPKTLK